MIGRKDIQYPENFARKTLSLKEKFANRVTLMLHDAVATKAEIVEHLEKKGPFQLTNLTGIFHAESYLESGERDPYDLPVYIYIDENNEEYTVYLPKRQHDVGRQGCFIATAVYSSPMTKEIYLLQNFRDEVLFKSVLGRVFVSIYYFLSPPIAKIVATSDFLRNLVRTIIIAPLLRIAKRNLDSERG